MKFVRLFIVRPVMTTLVMAAFVIFGVISYFLLPINDLPAVDFPTISVSASLPGANADTMASAVATPLEKQFTTIAGIDSMSSQSALGSTTITLQFNLDRNIDGAAQDVQAAIIAARPILPTSMPTPPTFRKVNPADAPIMYISLSSETLPIYSVDEYAETLLAERMSMVNGVAQVQVFGSQIYAVHVQVDPNRLFDYGIGIDTVQKAITNNNVNLPTGTLYGKYQSYNVMANGQLYNAAAFKPMIVAYRNGQPVRLRDLGDVIDSVQTDKVASWFNNKRAVILAVQRQPGTNTIQIVDTIKSLMPMFRASIPKSVAIDIMFDRSQGIRKSVSDVKFTLLVTVILVICVIFAFLGSVSATVIASLSLPIAIIGTFAAMKLLGFTVNNISLMGLTLSVGFVIDDAIVVLENIVRHLGMGKNPMQASLDGSQEIAFTVVSMTVSLIAVFIPILLMGGLIGRLFNEFAVTISIAILISGLVSLSLTPMLCSRFLKKEEEERPKNLPEKIFDYLVDHYEKTLAVALRHKRWVCVGFAIMLAATFFCLVHIPGGFMPSEDTGQLFGMTEAAQGISFDSMVTHQQALAAIVAKDPNVQSFMSSVGAGGPNSAGNGGRIFIVLKPRNERPIKDVDQLIGSFRKKLGNIPGIRLYLQNLPGIRVGGNLARSAYQFALSGPNPDELYATAEALEKKMKELPGLVDVNSDLQIKNLQINVDIDRDKCYELGISMSQVQSALNSAYSSRQVSTIYTPNNQYWVILEVEPRFYRDPVMLHMMYLTTSTGTLVPLSTVAKISPGAGPLLINHLGQFPCVTLSFNLKPGTSLGPAVDAVKELAKNNLPADITATFQGTAQIFESSIKNLLALLVVSILVIYIVLGILYESFIHPITILVGLPSAGLGALLSLMLFQKDLDIYGFLGLIMLVGIVKKNAIMMIDAALHLERTENKSTQEAIFQACLLRFRPIMMTTIAAIFGCLPMAINFNSGPSGRQTLGIAIVGGLMVSQLVTLYITPVFYIYLDRFNSSVSKRKMSKIQEALS